MNAHQALFAGLRTLVVDLETAKGLKALGLPQQSVLSYARDKRVINSPFALGMGSGELPHLEIYSAYTLGELHHAFNALNIVMGCNITAETMWLLDIMDKHESWLMGFSDLEGSQWQEAAAAMVVELNKAENANWRDYLQEAITGAEDATATTS